VARRKSVDNRILERFREYINIAHFNAFRISLASSDKMRSLSYGEVKKIETINYRTLKAERDGLFCPRIFGPEKDWECNCGKYKRMKHRGVVCEKCGVEVIQARVRRERMGHIELVAPVCHIWYLKGIPSYLGLILDMPVKDLERVIYFDAYLVIHQGNSPYPRKTLLNSIDYDQYIERNPQDTLFKAESGAESVQKLLKMMNLEEEIHALQEEYGKSTSVAVRHKIMRRVKILNGMLQAKIRPDWLILEVVPVLPAGLRPLVPLEGGRFASSDLNELYRRVLNRNIRLARLLEIEAPSVIIKNEKRMLQEAVDALIDNGRRGQPVRGTNRRPLKSLSEMLRGKQGRFRQNLLGKRVDYSGRSVIVVDPELKIYQCGLPKIMALELFKPFVYAELLRCEVVPNLRVAKKLVEQGDAVVWDALESVVKERLVLLNRAPTLHRLGIQAFYPILVDGKAIKIHPLVCHGFNADFDGDQMAVHVPLSSKAQAESENLVLSSKNLLSPANGNPVAVPSQDMVLGLHYMTKARENCKGEGVVFSNLQEVVYAFQRDMVDLHAQVKVRLPSGELVDTVVGRALLYEALPEGVEFYWVNKVLRKSDIKKLVERVCCHFDTETAVTFLDRLKKFGFYYSTRGGVSLAINDLIVIKKKDEIVKKAEQEVREVEQLYMDGAITNGERYNKVLSIWGRATVNVAKELHSDLSKQDEAAYLNKDKSNKPFNPIFMMLESGARSNIEQIKQLVGMRGLMAKPSGEIQETPVKRNFRDGLSVFEYFISTHGARKGQADTALKTANSGYLTRRLVDVAQDIVVTMHDCKTLGYVVLQDLTESGNILYLLADRVYGRVLAADVTDPITGEVIVEQGQSITKELAQRIKESAVTEVYVRSVLSCQARRGVCAKCYGLDLSRNELAEVGVAVGIIAAQSIGEPGTQLTMRTFHIGGTASGVTEQSVAMAKYEGTIKLSGMRFVIDSQGRKIVVSRKAKLAIVGKDGRELQEQSVEYGYNLLVDNNQKVSIGDKLFEWDANSRILITEYAGTVKFVDVIDNVTIQDRLDEATGVVNKIILEQRGERYQPAMSILDAAGNEIVQYHLPTGAYLAVQDGQQVSVGTILVKMPREATKTKDITGGLPRIAELFEARMPKDPAIIADIDGEVVFGGTQRGLRKVSVVAGSESYDYLIPRGKQLIVVNGDFVRAGDSLTVGSPVSHDMLRILGSDILQRYLVNQIQQIYRLEGIDVHDVHFEVIVRQMLRKVRIVDAGDTDFLIGDRVDKIHFQRVNELLVKEGKQPATAKPLLMGITMASSGAESFLSAASFQETTRILAEAAMAGSVDYLYGLKENVIIGKLIPAGTGVESFSKRHIAEESQEFEERETDPTCHMVETEKAMNTGA